MIFRSLLAGSTKTTGWGGIALSLGIHGGLAALAIAGGMERPDPPAEDSPWSKVFYLAPPPTAGGSAAREERITFVGLEGSQGGTEGLVDAAPEEDELALAARRAREARERAALDELPGTEGVEGAEEAGEVFLESQVENPVAFDPTSAVPIYPEPLRAQNVEGGAVVQFVVDTVGRADPMSFVVLESTHPLFVEAVRTALPRMRFSPAVQEGRRVRQLVQIPFLFKIEQAPPPSDTTSRDRTGADAPPADSLRAG